MTAQRFVLGVWLAAAVLVGAIIALPVAFDGGRRNDAGHTAATVDLAALDPEIAANYRFGLEHQDHFAAIDCYCGCVEFLGHRSLADCFVTATGEPEPHAAGCAVCNGEAALARALLGDDVALDEVVRQIDAVYGTTVGTVPPPT